MRACQECGGQLVVGARFCSACGASTRLQDTHLMPVVQGPVAPPVPPVAPHQARRRPPASPPPAPPASTGLLGSLRARLEDLPSPGTAGGFPAPVILAAVAAIVVVATVVIAIAVSGGEAAPASTSANEPQAAAGDHNISAGASVDVPDTAPESSDNAGQPVSYAAPNLVDDDPSTAWRMPGTATDRTIVLTWPEPHSVAQVGLINGYAKVDDVGKDDRYRQNRRVQEVTWIFDDGTEVSQRLDSTRDLQAVTLDEPIETTSLRLRIDKVSKPGGRDFTAISEISVVGR